MMLQRMYQSRTAVPIKTLCPKQPVATFAFVRFAYFQTRVWDRCRSDKQNLLLAWLLGLQ